LDLDAIKRAVRAIEPPLRLALMRIKAVASGEAIVVLTIAFWRLSNGLDASGASREVIARDVALFACVFAKVVRCCSQSTLIEAASQESAMEYELISIENEY
jgi:hypothetical protein